MDDQTTPAVSVSPVDTGLRERIAAALLQLDTERWGDHGFTSYGFSPYGTHAESDAIVDAVATVSEQAHGDLVVRNTNLRAERDRLARERNTLMLSLVTLAGELGIDSTAVESSPLGEAMRARDEVLRLRAVASRSTPAPPDGAVERLYRELRGKWRAGRHNGPAPTRKAALSLLADLGLSSPATGQEPATPGTWRTSEELSAMSIRAFHEQNFPVAPQAPAEPAECGFVHDGGTCAGSLDEPAGPAVPEDTATRPWTAHEVTVGPSAAPGRDIARCHTCPWRVAGEPREVADAADSHRADTTRPAGEEK